MPRTPIAGNALRSHGSLLIGLDASAATAAGFRMSYQAELFGDDDAAYRAAKRQGKVARGDRGAVTHMSWSSRKALREAVWSVSPALMPVPSRGTRKIRPASFVTLTYPVEDAPRHLVDPRLCKIHLERWWKRVRRLAPDSWAIWSLEFQKNGSPHFHLVVRWNPVPGNWMETQHWISESWAEVIAEGRDDPDGSIRAKSAAAGTNVKPFVSAENLAKYVTKSTQRRWIPGVRVAQELTKSTQRQAHPVSPGRWWGTLNKAGHEAAKVRAFTRLPPDIEMGLSVRIQSYWREFAAARGFKFEHLPQWVDGYELDRMLDSLGPRARERFWANLLVDLDTGEIVDVPLLQIRSRRLA